MRALQNLEFFGLAIVCGLALSCGSDGSLAFSGSTDWTFEGMGGDGALGAADNSTGQSDSSAAFAGMDNNGSPAAQGQAAQSSVGAGAQPGSAGAVGNAAAGGAGTATDNNASGTGGDATSSGAGGDATSSGAGGDATSSGAGGGTSSPVGGTSTGGSSVSSAYHQLPNWVEPKIGNPNHHGTVYFLGNAHKDENGLECTSCHGANYEGDTGPACTSCHSEWRSDCSFCHGMGLQGSPPPGVNEEMSTASLAVGRHDAHLNSSDSHVAFDCSTCHTIPPDNDVDHTLSYQLSEDLTTPGHHGDVEFAASVVGMTFDVDETNGSPIDARGSCVGSCHSDGHGGDPARMPYWAGGDWTSGCGNCHGSPPRTGHHSHALGQGADCADCHSFATENSYAAESHFNNEIDYLENPLGMTIRTDDSCASGIRCTGLCHGGGGDEEDENHNDCW